ncbi:MAG TPA: hypothetical protein PKE29_08535 [Phycisphaerales bacterium]|nr:hypothetical protein [Phycisphaerales bacterium]
MNPDTKRTWLWQTSYAVLGFCFLMSPVAMIATGNWIIPAIVGLAAIGLLFVLNRVINRPPPPIPPTE